MNNGSPLNQRGGFSPISRMNNCGGTFRSPSPRQPYGNGNFAANRSPSFQQQSFPSPLYNSSPYSTHQNAQQKQRFCTPNAEQHSVYDNRSFNSSQSSNSFRSERSFDGSFPTPHSQNSSRVNHLSGERACDKNSSFSPHSSWSSAENSPTNVDFISPEFPRYGNRKVFSANAFQGKKRLRNGTSCEHGIKSRSSDQWGTTTQFRSNVKRSCNNLHNSDEGMGRRLFRGSPSNENNPGHSADIDQYIDSSMLEDPWKELMEKLEFEKKKFEEKRLNST